MIEDVRLSCHDRIQVYHFGRLGGIVPNPQEIIDSFYNISLSINPMEAKEIIEKRQQGYILGRNC